MHPIAKKVWWSLFGVCTVYEIQRKWYGLCMTTGDSMTPTIAEGAVLLVCKRKGNIQKSLKRGDVVLCRSSEHPKDLIVKRVTAMEGDLIPCSEEPINSYLKFANHTTIPTGYIWLRGDNSKTSHDSRFYGPVSQALVQGRVIYQIRPIFKKIESGL